VTDTLSAAQTRAMGTTARIVVCGEGADDALPLMAEELERIEQACSRFRGDSDLSRVNASGGHAVTVDPLLIDAVEIALRAARVTDGRVDPTIGHALRLLGYDRDFATIDQAGPEVALVAERVRGWECVVVDRTRATVRVPPGVLLDLGATAKAFAADRAAQQVATALGCGVLVSLGGDIALAGPAPAEGWPIRVTDDHTAGFEAPGQVVALTSGGLASSSVTVRRWTQGREVRHHLIDPETGLPVTGPYRTVCVTAGTCVDANIASTAALVLGEAAPEWLEARALPARLTRHDGHVVHVAGWPESGFET
jgi:thiamine biosynthesis lipoprotein ApbE